MTISAKASWVLFVVVLAAGAAYVARVDKEVARRARALEAAREQNQELRELEDQHKKLAADQLPAGEIKALQRKREEVEALRRRLAALQQRSAREEDHPNSGAENETVAADAWIYAGQKSPKAALESALWSASRGDVDKLTGLLALGPKVRAGVESLITQLPPATQQDYGTPQKLIATLMAGSFPENISAITPDGESAGTNSAALSVRIDYSNGQPKDTLFSFVRTPAGWQLVVPPSVASSYAMAIFGPGQPQK